MSGDVTSDGKYICQTKRGKLSAYLEIRKRIFGDWLLLEFGFVDPTIRAASRLQPMLHRIDFLPRTFDNSTNGILCCVHAITTNRYLVRFGCSVLAKKNTLYYTVHFKFYTKQLICRHYLQMKIEKFRR